MNSRKSVYKKKLPPWFVISAILAIIIVLFVIFNTLLKDFGNQQAMADKEMIRLQEEFFAKAKNNRSFFRRLNPTVQQRLIDQGKVPKEWAEDIKVIPPDDRREAPLPEKQDSSIRP
jgi:signal transduction histidine kinase